MYDLTLKVLFILCCTQFLAGRLFCPPPNLKLNSNRPYAGLKTAIIGEVHGQLWVQTQTHPVGWTHYFDGHQLARNFYIHVGILGIDKIHLIVFYNETLYPNSPTVEDIYPSKRFCVADWYRLGVLDWRPVKYGGAKETWPYDEKGNHTLDRDYYKTQRGYHPIYAGIYDVVHLVVCLIMSIEIKNHTDWVFVLDMDEVVIPVNLDTKSQKDWCGYNHPPLVSRILEQMQTVASRHMLASWGSMMEYSNKNVTRDGSIACPLGSSYSPYEQKCRPFTAFMLPIYLWIRGRNSPVDSLPTIRSNLPGFYAPNLKSIPRDGHEERWKSVYQTRYNPPLAGMCIHANDVDRRKMFQILAPRDFHQSLSMELVHQRFDNHQLTKRNISQLMKTDYRLMHLVDDFHQCMEDLAL